MASRDFGRISERNTSNSTRAGNAYPTQARRHHGRYHRAAGSIKERATATSESGDSTPTPDDPAGHPPADSEPDARFTLANERTFLAWSRTSLALIAAGLAVARLLPPFPGVPWGRSVIATPLILLGAVLSWLSYFEWKNNQHALQHGKPMPRSQLPKILALVVALVALVGAAVDLYSKVSGH